MTRPDFYSKAGIDRRIKKGRGQGSGPNYQSWLRIKPAPLTRQDKSWSVREPAHNCQVVDESAVGIVHRTAMELRHLGHIDYTSLNIRLVKPMAQVLFKITVHFYLDPKTNQMLLAEVSAVSLLARRD